jgi:hypothetical protein
VTIKRTKRSRREDPVPLACGSFGNQTDRVQYPHCSTCLRAFAMVSPLFFSQLMRIALVWLCLILHGLWPSDPVAACATTLESLRPRRKRRREPQPFVGLPTKPYCDACAPPPAPRPHAPSAPPPRLVMTRGRHRALATSHHCCPNPARSICDSRWVSHLAHRCSRTGLEVG